MNNNRIENLVEKEFSNVRILVDYPDYDIARDNRILIPFSYYQYYGLMNKHGEIVVEPKFDRILDSCRTESDLVRVGIHFTCGFNRVTKDPSTYLHTKFGLVNSIGHILLEPKYRGIGVSDDQKTITIQHMDYQYEVIDVDGNIIVPKGTYTWIDSFSNGFARVNRTSGEDKKWGIIDCKGNVIVPLQFTNIWNFYKKKRNWVTIEAIDEHGNKRIGKFDFITREVTI